MNDLVRLEDGQMIIADEAVKQIVKFERGALKINMLKENIREQALAKMEELGIDKYVSPDGSLTINYFPERTSKRLDSTNLITLCPMHHKKAEQGIITKEELLKMIESQ